MRFTSSISESCTEPIAPAQSRHENQSRVQVAAQTPAIGPWPRQTLLQKWRSALALKWLWLVHVYTFNWAHKPLCDRFRHDVIRIGRVHLCRSCVLVYVGIFAGVVASIAAPSFLQAYGTVVFASIAAVTVLFSMPFWYKRWPRRVRDVLRFGMGLSIALCGSLLVSGEIAVGLVGAMGLIAFWRVYLALRRARRLRSCAGCGELDGQGICSGYQTQTKCLRAYEQQATLWLLSSTSAPPSTSREPSGT